ncbi:MAG: hypothetical protein M0Z99_35620 [Betaproteobacteria bacterium]|nr:hypothetical protein [Betaproteobacteria bacterium]
MAISGCAGGLARNHRQHGAAQQSGGEADRQDASAIGAQPLTARTP